MKDRRPLYLLAVFVVILTASVGLRSVDGATKNEQPRTTLSTTPSSTTVPPPTTSIIKHEWRPALERIFTIENAAFRTADPTMIDAMIDSSCPCYEETKRRLINLQQKGWHVASDNLVITSADVIKVIDQNQIEVLVNISVPGHPVVDSTGQVIEQGRTGNGTLLYILRRGTDNLWRVIDRHSVKG